MAILDGKIALVTGASRGIGRAIAEALGREGATILGTATTENGANAISMWLDKERISGQGLRLDLTDISHLTNWYQKLSETVGAPDILINNAGITHDNLLIRMKEEEWDEVFAINLKAAFLLSKLCLKNMIKARWGRIISLSSVVALSGNPGQANYAASKAALIAFTKSMAREVASRGVTCNAVAPGFISTDMTNKLTETQQNELLKAIPVGRMGSSEEVAHAVLFLASPKASYITGETIHVNGGMLMA